MICCKIIANFNDKEGSFIDLCKRLAKKGDWMWRNGDMFFADTEGPTDEKAVIRMVKKAGYKKVYVDIYDVDNEPRESDDIKSWLGNRVMKIYYNQYEREHQQAMRETKVQLDALEAELDGIIREAIDKQKETESETTEDSE